MTRNSARALAFASLAAAPLGGCAGDSSLLRWMGLQADPGRKTLVAPDFVVDSRGKPGDYMPVGVDAPKRPMRARNGASQKALESELEGARRRNEDVGKAAEGAGKGVGKGLNAPRSVPDPLPDPAPATDPAE